MPIFETADQLYTCFGGLLERMESQVEIQRGLESVDLTIRFTFTDPAATMSLILNCGDQSIYYGECKSRPDLELAMTGDVAHRFWMGEINVMAAIAKRQIVFSGSFSKMLNLAPLIKGAIKIYPQHFQDFCAKISAIS